MRYIMVCIFLFSIFKGLLPLQRNIAFLYASNMQQFQYTYDRSPNLSLEKFAAEDCRLFWQIGILASKIGNVDQKNQSWLSLLNCSSHAVSWLYGVEPNREDLALLAVKQYPEAANAWFWLGELTSTKDDVTASQYYTMSVKINPMQDIAWCRLGHAEERLADYNASLQSFVACCSNGDPGSHGCYGAGRIAEKLGKPQLAIQYYRLSRWQPSRDRAAELERQLHLTPTP